MLGWMDDEALHRTLTTGRATYWSRSRGEYWVKGDTSGHVQHVREVRARLRRRHAAGQGRPGRRRLPHRRPHLLRRRPRCSRRREPRRPAPPTQHNGRHARCAHARTSTASASSPATAGSSRSPAGCSPTARPRSALPQARRRPAGHLPAGVGRARRRLVALLVRRRAVARHADRARRAGALARRPAGRRADRRRPARRAARDRRGAAHPSGCRACRRSPAAWSASSATTPCAGSSGCPTSPPTTCTCPSWR